MGSIRRRFLAARRAAFSLLWFRIAARGCDACRWFDAQTAAEAARFVVLAVTAMATPTAEGVVVAERPATVEMLGPVQLVAGKERYAAHTVAAPATSIAPPAMVPERYGSNSLYREYRTTGGREGATPL